MRVNSLMSELQRVKIEQLSRKSNSAIDHTAFSFNNKFFVQTEGLPMGSQTKRYICSFCSYCTNIVTNIRNHTLTHTGEKPFVCPICGKGFTQKHRLKSHSVLHTGDHQPYRCMVCRASFRTSNELANHIQLTHGSNYISEQ